MKDIHSATSEAFETDPIAIAERLTGVRASSGFDNPATLLGFALAQEAAQERAGLLLLNDDTNRDTDLKGLKRILSSEGFAVVLEESTGRDTLILAWSPVGALVCAESYQNGKSINSAKLYYNLRLYPGATDVWKVMGSGGMRGDVLIGDHDIREGFRHKLNGLRSVGDFLPGWVERPFLWLCSYTETKGTYDYKAINSARLARLPAEVQEAIAGQESSLALG